MLTRRITLSLLGLFLVSIPASALEMGIVTGGQTGTYIKIGDDIRQLLQSQGNDIELKVYPSAGSLENVEAVYKRREVQLGIVQSDVLGFIEDQHDNPELKRIARKTKVVFPLYNEEIHILAPRDSAIETFAHLHGKRVAVGKSTSGTFLTTQRLFHISEINPAEQLPIGGEDALQALREDKVDAMIYVAGSPVQLFRENVADDDKLRLVPITEKELSEWYVDALIPASSYTWQDEEVPTIAVKATLISFNYRRAHCTNVGRIASLIYTNIDWLRQHGHEKWQTVNLDENIKKWDQYDCVTQALNQTKAQPQPQRRQPNTSDQNPILKSLERQRQQ